MLPKDVPSVAELVLWVDVDAGPTTAQAIDGLDLWVVDGTGASHQIWSTRPSTLPNLVGGPLPQRVWTPVLLDLARWAGQSIRLRAVFDTLDGRNNEREGVAIGRLRVWVPCLSNREPPQSPGACDRSTEVKVHPLADRLVMSLPPPDSHADGCLPCESSSTCVSEDACSEGACQRGYCAFRRVPGCCDEVERWPSNPSFEAELEGWDVSGAWQLSSLRAQSGRQSLHFGLVDGSALAPEGQTGMGLARSAPFRLTSDMGSLSFSAWLSTEWDVAPSLVNPGGVDLLEVLVWLEDLPSLGPVAIWNSSELGGTTRGEWQRVEIDLHPWRGQVVRVGWSFNTGDTEANRPGAVFIDELSLRANCSR